MHCINGFPRAVVRPTELQLRHINSNCAQTATITPSSSTLPQSAGDQAILRAIALTGSATGLLTIPFTLGDARIVSLNINGLTEDKLMDILFLMEAFLVDILILIDTRCDIYHCKKFRDLALGSMGGGSHVCYAAVGSHMAGGQMILSNSDWGCKFIDFWQDDSTLGLVTATRFQIGGFKLMVIGTYWPVLPQPKPAVDRSQPGIFGQSPVPGKSTSEGLWNRCESWLQNPNDEVIHLTMLRLQLAFVLLTICKSKTQPSL